MAKGEYIVVRQPESKVIRWFDPDGADLMACINDEPETFQEGDEIYRVRHFGTIKKPDPCPPFILDAG